MSRLLAGAFGPLLFAACAAQSHPPQEVRVVVVREPAPTSQVAPITPPGLTGATTASAHAPLEPSPSTTASAHAPLEPSPSTAAPPPHPAVDLQTGTPAIALYPPGPIGFESAPLVGVPGDHPLADCAVRRYASGWVLADCDDLEVALMAGFASRMSKNFQRDVAADRFGLYKDERTLRIGGKKTVAWQLSQRQMKTVDTIIGPQKELDRNGTVLRRSLYARLSTSDGQLGAVCSATADLYDESRCAALLGEIARHGVPGGTLSSTLTVAGVPLALRSKRCWAPEPRQVYCFLDGGLRWAVGSSRDMSTLQARMLRDAPLAPMTEAERQEQADFVNSKRDEWLPYKQIAELQQTGAITTTEMPVTTAADIEQFKQDIHTESCTIGGVESECTRIDYYGVLDHPAEFHYYARVPRDGQTWLLHCSQSASEPAPLPCREVFGSFTLPAQR